MTFFNIKLLLSLMILYHCSSATDDVKDEADSGASDAGALWFGPRLGKRSLKISTEDNRQTFLRLLDAADALKYYYDQLPYYTQPDDPEARVTKKVIFTPKLGRSLKDLYPEKRFENVEFTPRLGRRLSEDMVTPSEQEMYKQDPEQLNRRTKFFSPRLGRAVNFSPRLGRELSYDLYPQNIRLARSTNETKTT